MVDGDTEDLPKTINHSTSIICNTPTKGDISWIGTTKDVAAVGVEDLVAVEMGETELVAGDLFSD